MATLLITVPEAGDIVHEIAETVSRVGRDPDNDIRIDDASIAAHHALFVPTGKFHRLQNLDENQQTWVNDQAQMEAELTGRCFIRLGKVECIYSPEDPRKRPLDALPEINTVINERDAVLALCHSLARDLRSEQDHHRQTQLRLMELTRQIQTNERALHEARTRAELARREQLRAANEKLTAEVAAAHHEMEMLTSRWNDLVAKLRRVHEAEAQVNHLLGDSPAYSATFSHLIAEEITSVEAFPPTAEQIVADFEPVAENPEAGLVAALQAMQEASERLNSNTHDQEALHGSFGHARALAQHADAVGSVGAVRRLASALEALLGDLCKIPEQFDGQKLRSLQDALDTLRTLAARDQFSTARDSFRAKICVISDDAEEPMIAALRLVDLDLLTFNYPTARLDSAGEQDSDLIILDASSPEHGWEELCARVRNFTRHETTPIIILIPFQETGERLSPASPGGHEDFIDKPFNIFEMSVKILGNIFRHRLASATPA